MPNDGYVQVAADSVGKKVDASELTRVEPDDTGTPVVVERQRVAIGSDDDPTHLVEVRGGALMVRFDGIEEITTLLKRAVMLLQILANQEITDNDVKGM